MKSLSENQKILFSFIFVLAIGFLTTKISKIAILWILMIFVGGVYLIIKTRNRDGIAHLIVGYVLGAEIYFRMAFVGLPWELGKITAILFLSLGLYVEQRQRIIPWLIILYGVLLLPAFILSIDYFHDIMVLKSKYLFSLAGPTLLVVSSIYFYRRSFSMEDFVRLSRWTVLGVLTMSLLVYLNVGDYAAIEFTGSSNAHASGGFSGNQVSLAFGIGILMIGVNLILQNKLFFSVGVDILLVIVFIFQGLMTFSRGGILGAMLALSLGAIVYYLSNMSMFIELLTKHWIKIVLAVFLAMGVFSYVNEMSGGMLAKRYFNVDERGFKVKKSYGTGRGAISKGDFMLFEDSSYTGVGVGVSPIERPLHRNYAAHVEFTRMIAEHGILGVFALMILFLYPFKHFISQIGQPINQMIAVSFIVFSLFSMSHSATRIAAITFFYGMGFLIIKQKEKCSEK